MKFSHSLQFNAVPEWSSKYINYSGLKKLIYSLQREYAETLNYMDPEALPFTAVDEESNPVNVFIKALDKEAVKINSFFQIKEKEALASYENLIDEVEEFEREFPQNLADIEQRHRLRQILVSLRPGKFADETHESGPAPDIEPVTSQNARGSASNELAVTSPKPDKNPNEMAHRGSQILFDDDDFNLSFLEALKVEKRKPLADMFVFLSELKSYVELNKIGFGKALKKFDKTLHTKIKDEYMDKLENSHEFYVFRPEAMEELNLRLAGIIKLYSVFTHGNEEQAKEELKSNLREYIVWERNTVWRNMIGMERKAQAARVQKPNVVDSVIVPAEKIDIYLGAGRKISIPTPILTANGLKALLIAMVTITLLIFSPLQDEQQKNCFAVLVCASLLWATEAIPLFTTSLLLPFLIVVLRTLVDPDSGEPLRAVDASKFICSAMWSPIIMLLLGGFTLAAALSKYNLDKIACTFILSKVPQKPASVLLSIMCVSTVVSAFISNVAAPVLMLSVIQPVLNTLPEGSQFAEALVIGIALASNVAGMASPIASPQNVVALQSMDPDPNWLQWFAVSIPVCTCGLVLIFIYIMFMMDFRDATIVPIRSTDEKFTHKHFYVLAVSLSTIILWCGASFFEPIVGDMGMIAVASMVAFYAPGILSPDDFNNYPWTIVMLAMGGLALGKAVTVSGLLRTIAEAIQAKLEGSALFTVLCLFGIIVLVMATFVSHTVAALIIVPLIAEIGRSLPDPHPNLLIMATALLCSSAMGLPTSGFPNVTAIGLRDSVGNPYLSVSTFIKIGVPSSLLCYVVVVSVGYLVMKLLDF